MPLRTRCSFWPQRVIAASPMTVEVTVAQPALEWKRHGYLCRRSRGTYRGAQFKKAVLVGHSTGGGEVTRYIGRHGTKRVAKAVLIGAVPPLMLKTDDNPDGTPIKAFDDLRAMVVKDRSQFWKDLSMPFYGYNRPGAKASDGVRESFWLRA